MVISGPGSSDAITINNVQVKSDEQYAYNLTVAQDHTYFVGNTDMWVLNVCDISHRTGAKRGPKTEPDAPHNKKIREVGDEIVDEGGTIIAGGGRKKERLLPTAGGHKGSRRPDVLYEDCNGNICAVNVGKTKADGSPIKREQEALEDLNKAGIPTTFRRYD